MDRIAIHVELPIDEAWALAQFLKRLGHAEYRALAKNNGEADHMRNASYALRIALAQQGVTPR